MIKLEPVMRRSVTKNAMVENTNQYLEKTEIEGFGGNLFLYKRLENANAD